MKKTLLLFLFFLVVSAFELMGQTVSNNNLYVGYYASDQGVAIVDGNGNATYNGTNINNIFVGYGSNSTYNNCTMYQPYVYIPGSWYVNYQGNNNSGIVDSSGFYVYGNSYLGFQPGSSNGTIQVESNSYFSGNPGDAASTNFIGYQGSSNTFLLNNSTNSFTYTIIGGTNTNDFSNVASNNTFSINNYGLNFDAGMFILSSGNNLIITDSSANNDTDNNESSSDGDFCIYGYSNTVILSNDGVQSDYIMYIGGSNYGANYPSFSNNIITITSNSAWINYGNDSNGDNIVASSGNQIIISNGSYMINYANFYLGLYGSSNSMTLASNSSFVLQGNEYSYNVSMYVGNSAGTISNNIYIYDTSYLYLPGGNIYLFVGNTNGASGNIYISNNSGSGSNLNIDGNTYIYNGTLSLHGTNACLTYNYTYQNVGNIYLYNGTLYCGENPGAFTNMETIGLGNNNGTNATNTNTNASLYLSTNGVTSMYFTFLQFWNNVNIYNINPNNSQQIINVSVTLFDSSTVATIGNISFISNVSLDNNIDPIINFGSSSGFSNDFTSNFTFSVTGATVGQSSNASTGSNYLYFWIQTNANITVAQSINETNAFNVNSLTYTAGTFTVSTPYVGINMLNMISNSSLVLTDESLTVSKSLSFLMSTLNTNTNLLIGPGITLSTPNTSIGAVTDADCKLLNEGTWDNSSNFFLGYGSGGNTVLDLQNGGVLSNAGMTVIGSNGNNALNIISNSTCYASNLIMESAYIGNSNIVNVNGGRLYVTNNSVVNTNPALNYSLIVGYVGSHDYLNISNGGYVTNSLGVIGYSTNSSNNYACVTGAGSQWINTNGFYVGFMGGKNNLLISNGGSVYVNGFQSFVGLASSSNTVTITGTNSLFSNYGLLNIGYHGSYNKIMISNAGMLIDNNMQSSPDDSYAAMIGVYSNNNSVTIGTNGLWTNNGNLFIGCYGSSNSVTNNGGTLDASGVYIGFNSGNHNSLVINSGTVNTDVLQVGNGGSNYSSLILASANAYFNLANSSSLYLYGTISNAGTITISNTASGTVTNQTIGSIYNTGTMTINANLYNYGYISNGGTITASAFYNLGTLVGNPVNASVTYNDTPTLQSSGMMMGDHLVEMPHMIPLEQNDEISINEENAAYFVKEALQLASSLVYAQKPPPPSKPSHKKAFHHKKVGKKVYS